MATTRASRLNALKGTGFSSTNLYSFTIPSTLKAGDTIQITIGEDGQLSFDTTDMSEEAINIAEDILSDGYVKNTKLFRRWVMAQMFRMLNYHGYYGNGYSAALHMYPYKYQFSMMLDELNVLSKLQNSDLESFKERSQFFTPDVVSNICCHYLQQLKSYVNTLPTRNYQGSKYVRVCGRDILLTNLDRDLYNPLRELIPSEKNSYAKLYRELNAFYKKCIFPVGMNSKIPLWIDVFKGEGSFYTLKNLIMYHDCYVEADDGTKVYKFAALDLLNKKAKEYEGEYWKLHAFMKNVITINNFDFKERMKEIYSK